MELKTPMKTLTHQLAYFARAFGKPRGSATTILVPLTHQVLADVPSIFQRNCFSGYGKITEGAVYCKHDKNIVIYSLARLEKEAYS